MDLNKQDSIRSTVLKFFYDRNTGAHNRGLSRASEGEVHVYLQSLHESNELSAALTYLLDRKLICIDQEKYRITADGISHIEGVSMFDKSPAPINFTNVAGVTVIGDNNYIQNRYTSVYNELESLKNALIISPQLSQEQKLEANAEIGTITSQLAIPEPSKPTIRSAWAKIESFATLAGAIDGIQKIKNLLDAFLN